MVQFIEATWPLWWILAILAILRWFDVNSEQWEHIDAERHYTAAESRAKG